MLSILSCVCRQSVYLLWRNVYLGLLPIFGLSCQNIFNFLKINLFILFFKFLAALGICCCVRASSSCVERGLLFIAVCRLLIAVASLVAERALDAQAQQLWLTGSRAQAQ